jgi:hypothetical protein
MSFCCCETVTLARVIRRLIACSESSSTFTHASAKATASSADGMPGNMLNKAEEITSKAR